LTAIASPTVHSGREKEATMRFHLKGFVIAITIAFIANAGAVRAGPLKNKTLVVDVAEDLTSFNFAPAADPGAGFPPNGPFMVMGLIYAGGTLGADGSVPEGAVAIGRWFCHGFVNGPFYTSTDVYLLDGVGQIVASQGGPLDLVADTVKAITGGTGAFLGIGGQVTWVRVSPPNLNFRATFTY
jgi:hypothetical protein